MDGCTISLGTLKILAAVLRYPRYSGKHLSCFHPVTSGQEAEVQSANNPRQEGYGQAVQ